MSRVRSPMPRAGMRGAEDVAAVVRACSGGRVVLPAAAHAGAYRAPQILTVVER